MVRDGHTQNLITCFSLACDLARQIRTTLNFLRNDILARHKEKLTKMTGRFNDTFVSHICHTLHNAVRQGKDRLEAFNRKLRNHFFGEEYYPFEYQWILEFREYYNSLEEAALDYLCGTLGLQVIFIVPTKSAGALHDHVDQILQVTRFFQEHPRGELNSSVMVTPTLLKENAVAQLWQRQRIAIENRAHQMTFLELMNQ